MLNGLPNKDELGIYQTTSSSLSLKLHTDSESAMCVGKMFGLLRKVRHIELRALLVQELHQQGRLEIMFVPGPENPVDSLTKPSDLNHLMLLLWAR